MLSFFTILMSWRLTGVVLHEWIGIALIAMIVVHLLVHWGWVESRLAAMTRRSQRRFGALLLNAAVFVAMGATIVSGLVVSKVLVPNRLSPANYLHWHGLHESAATLTVVLLGLHVALNWDRIRGGVQRALAVPVRGSRSSWRWSGVPVGLVLRRLAWIVLASAALTGIVWSAVRLTPGRGVVIMTYPDGHRELRAPPPEITRLWPGSIRPAPAVGAPRFLVSLALLLIAAVAGRRLLTIRRGRRRRARNRSPQFEPTALERPSSSQRGRDQRASVPLALITRTGLYLTPIVYRYAVIA